MKYLGLLFVLFLFAPSTAFAQNQASSASQIENMKDRYQMRKSEIMEKNLDLKKRVEEKRIEIKDQLSTRRSLFKEKVENLKDTRKQKIVSRIDEKLASINLRSTNHYAEVLEKFSMILTKLKEKAKVQRANGADTASLDEAITQAQSSIELAQAAVISQAGKEYIPQITDEGTLRGAMSTSMTTLRSDLQGVKVSIQVAKNSLLDVAKVLRALEKPEVTVPIGEVQK